LLARQPGDAAGDAGAAVNQTAFLHG
jgi:hypothetical protein